MKIDNWLKSNAINLKGKTVVLTGSTSGLGLACLNHLAKLGTKVVVGVRNTKLANEQINTLKNQYPDFEGVVFELDLSDISKIKNFAENVKKLCPNGIDALLNNAGIFAQKKEILKTKYEKHFFVNTIAPIILSNLLLPSLEKKQDSKLVFVSSISFLNAKLDLNNIDFRDKKGDIKTYANSKRWLTFYAMELKKELKNKGSNVCVNICHPGISSTSLMSTAHGKFGKFTSSFVKIGMSCLFPSVKKACLSEIYALCTDTEIGSWIGPAGATNVYGKPKIKKIKIKYEKENISKICYDKLTDIVKNCLK